MLSEAAAQRLNTARRGRSKRAVSINILKVIGGVLLAWGTEGAFHFARRRREDPDGVAVTEWVGFALDRSLPYLSSLAGFWFLIVAGAALLWLDVPLVFRLNELSKAFEYDWRANYVFFLVVGIAAGIWLAWADRLSAEMHHPFLPESAAHLVGGIVRIALVIYWLILTVEAAVQPQSTTTELLIGCGLLALSLAYLASGSIGSWNFWERHEVHRLNAHEYPLSYASVVALIIIFGAVCLRGQGYGNGKDCRPLGAPPSGQSARGPAAPLLK